MYKQKLSKPKAKHHSRLLSLHAFWVQKSLTLLLASSELCVPEDEEVQRTTRPQCLRGHGLRIHCPGEDKPSFE